MAGNKTYCKGRSVDSAKLCSGVCWLWGDERTPVTVCVCSRIIPQFSFPGTIGMNNRGAMGGTNVPAPAPPAAGPGAMIPDGAMGMVVYHHLLFVHTFKMQIMLFPVLSTSC